MCELCPGAYIPGMPSGSLLTALSLSLCFAQIDFEEFVVLKGQWLVMIKSRQGRLDINFNIFSYRDIRRTDTL
jgi:hypothetical protein